LPVHASMDGHAWRMWKSRPSHFSLYKKCGQRTQKHQSKLGMVFGHFLLELSSNRSFRRFAFLNAIAAHDYSFNWEEMTVMAERYDDHLSDFLKGILTRQDSQKTVIFLRSDHGLQRGPMAMDYAQQVEHRRPWTEILVPEILIPSKVAFFENQLRMTTGFDLYNTIRSLLARSNGVRDEEGVPKIWSFDLLSEVVPLNRTCIDAKVDPKLCRRAPIPRDYGVCNVLDHKQVNFCSSS
jgi:Protein of unknown function (DUF229)